VRGSNCTISSRNCACGACLSNVPLLKTSFERIDGEVYQDSDVRPAAQVVRQGAVDAEDYLRHAIEKRPYTTALVALGIGWLIGRRGRIY
jgi:hypothetical protein